jgi:hypothetical protein
MVRSEIAQVILAVLSPMPLALMPKSSRESTTMQAS